MMHGHSGAIGPDHPRFIYFIQSGEGGPIKIGISDDPDLRLRRLQTASCEQLKLLGVVPGDEAMERAYHARLAAHRIRGEWFTATDEVLSCIPEKPSPVPLTFDEAKERLQRTLARKILQASLAQGSPSPTATGIA